MAWDVLDAAAGAPWGFPQWDAGGPEGEDVRIASVGQLSVIYFANRALRHLSVPDIVWLGQPSGDNAPSPPFQRHRWRISCGNGGW
ncbi:hypothetical protein ACGFNV_44840 [Streptomyces sp. NPDC048751]|uniref:hypothetical protein n=1 Tax=Streptomyces sp. NPDC048751 TaxID=3365591 RepID=UPI003720E86F